MPRISAEYRARMCSFTYSDGRRCRLPRAATGEGYCHAHAAKIRKQREEQFVAAVLAEPVAHSTLTSTSLTFMLARLFTMVANGHIAPKTSNALLRIVDGLRKTLSGTRQEFLNCYDSQGLRTLVEKLHSEHEEFLRLAECESLDDALRTRSSEKQAEADVPELATGTQPEASPAGSDERPELIPTQFPRPRPVLSPEEILKRLEQRLAAR